MCFSVNDEVNTIGITLFFGLVKCFLNKQKNQLACETKNFLLEANNNHGMVTISEADSIEARNLMIS